MPEFVVVTLLDDAPAELHPSGWPLHMTLAHMDAESTTEQVSLVVGDVAASVPSFRIEPGPGAGFGPLGDVPVVRVTPDAAPRQLHTLLTEAIRANGWRMRDPYWGPQFAPHVSDTSAASFLRPHLVDAVSLWERGNELWLRRASGPLAPEAAS